MDKIEQSLHNIGLTPNETKLYLYLLEHGISTPPQLAKGLQLARPNCYDVLRRLIEKNLIEEQRHGKRKAYLASDPAALLRSWERKREVLNDIVPDLRALYSSQTNKPKIQFYDGFEQVKQIYEQTLSAQEIFGIASTEQIMARDPQFFKQYLKKLQQRNIVFHDILTSASTKTAGPQMKTILRGLYEMKFLPRNYTDVPVDILLWNDHIALINISEPVFGTVLTNNNIVQMFRIVFDVTWKTLP